MSEQHVEARLDEVDKMGQALQGLEQQLREQAANALGRIPDGQLAGLNAQMALLANIMTGLGDRRRGLLSMLDVGQAANEPTPLKRKPTTVLKKPRLVPDQPDNDDKEPA